MNQQRLFLGCFLSLIATAFGFVVRGAILGDLAREFDLSNEQLGYINGAGSYPFAISIILLSLVIDRIGYGRTMAFAFFGHVVSALMTIFATSFAMLYAGMFLFALANGAVEAVINPVVATIYGDKKTHWLNILHAGWPGGIVFGGLLAIAISQFGGEGAASLWRWQMALLLIPTMLYGILLAGQKFPVQERVAAGVSYHDMLREFGWGSSFIVFFLLVAAINQVLVVVNIQPTEPWVWAAIAVVPTVAFALYVKSFGRPMFVFLLVIMFLLATTEIGTDGWISDIMRAVLGTQTKGLLFIIYTSAIMFGLRFFAGPIVHALSPLGLLAGSAAIACVGLLWLANAGAAVGMLFLAATFYGLGKTFFWPTTLGVVAEQYPRGGALMLNAIAGVGMIFVGTLGNPAIGFVQDRALDQMLAAEQPALHAEALKPTKGLFGTVDTLDQAKFEQLTTEQKDEIDPIIVRAKQGTLAKVAVLPAIMFVCYVGLLVYFQSRGGYKPEVLISQAEEDELMAGGVEGPVR
ncbi:MAG TPA: MFS transporter [Pirellulales bacterium]|jgi:MFS family permease|nr:MFS transporter [Pirellulales bacterium]